MDISILEDKPFSLSAFVDKLTTGGINLDTISFKARQDSARLLYGLHIGNKSGNLDQIASLGFNGYITDNQNKDSVSDAMPTYKILWCTLHLPRPILYWDFRHGR